MSPKRVKRWPLLRVARRKHAIEHVDAGRDAGDDVLRRADAHQIAGPVGRQGAAPCDSARRASLPWARRPTCRRWHSRRSPMSTSPASDASRRSSNMPPCTIPKSAFGLARASNSAARAPRPAQRELHRCRRLVARGGYGVHSSNTMAISESSARWICIEISGVSSSRSPLTGDANATPSSRTLRRAPRLQTWNPPESVRSERCQPMKRCRPRCAAITSTPGRSQRWNVLPSTICAPRRFELVRRHRLDRAVRADRHEHGRVDGAVRSLEPAARARPDVACSVNCIAAIVAARLAPLALRASPRTSPARSDGPVALMRQPVFAARSSSIASP